MKQVFIAIFITISCVGNAQNSKEWDGNYKLQLSDFQSSATEIGEGNIYSLHSSAGFDFSFYMSNAEFMFTKNFNSKVNCSFNRNAASLVAPDSAMAMDLVDFARYGFDLSELYARKLRKKLYEEKGAFSDISFFKPIYEEIQQEFNERHAIAGKTTDLGRNRAVLYSLQIEVLAEIEQLSDFCKTCKAPKKKK